MEMMIGLVSICVFAVASIFFLLRLSTRKSRSNSNTAEVSPLLGVVLPKEQFDGKEEKN